MSRTLEDILTDVYNGLRVSPTEQQAVLVALGPSDAGQYGIYPNETTPTPAQAPKPAPAPAKAAQQPKVKPIPEGGSKGGKQ